MVMKWYMNSNVVYNVQHATVASTTQIKTHIVLQISMIQLIIRKMCPIV